MVFATATEDVMPVLGVDLLAHDAWRKVSVPDVVEIESIECCSVTHCPVGEAKYRGLQREQSSDLCIQQTLQCSGHELIWESHTLLR